jgi:hypothetical protein
LSLSGTPKSLIEALELVTKPAQQIVASAETLGAARATHLRRVRSIFEDPNIIGAGIAAKVTEDKTVDELGICFYVKKKLPKAKVSKDHMLPPVIAGAKGEAIFTDVVELGTIVAQASVNKKRKPIVSGFSVGHVDATAGTVGAIVRRGKKRYILSNSHVLAEMGLASKGDKILYPGPADGGEEPDDVVGKLTHFAPVEVTDEFENTVDAALAEVLAARLGDIDPDIRGASTPLRVADPKREMRVVARGRTSRNMESVIRDVNFKIQVQYDDVGVVGFRDQVLCEPYTAGGDSGSLIVDRDSGAIVGLHFCGSPEGGVFTPIKTVMEALKFKF